MNWLDTETKAILHKEPESKPAPPKAGEFALILLMKGPDPELLVRAVSRVNECGKAEAMHLASLPVPATINPGLSEAEALYGQFELICCDSVSVFIRSDVWQEQIHSDYMNSLLLKVVRSPEFEPTKVNVLEVPSTESGRKFVDQFLAERVSSLGKNAWPIEVKVPFKKARIMKHWARRTGARISCEAIAETTDEEEST